MSTCSQRLAETCAENIALLHLLHTVPVPPSCNNVDTGLTCQGNYSLTINQEQTLGSTLAFLSNIIDDTKHVPALCIEENIESASLDVMLAVNKTCWGDGKEILKKLKHRFDEIFAILSKASKARDQNRALERSVFASIVAMCSSRILSRLRLTSNKRGTSKQPLQAVLLNAVNSLKQLNTETDIRNNLPVKLFIERARDIMSLTDAWTNHQKSAELENLIEGVYRLKQVEGFQSLLESIPNRLMNPSSRKSLSNIVNKVSRYRESARILYRMAKKVPLLQRASTKLINLPEEAFRRFPDTQPPQLEPFLGKHNKTHRKMNFKYLCSLLKANGAQLNNEFAAQRKKSLSKAKIHAEIQLVVHYELNISRLPPRVVCSSKDACFLCNVFIMMHGKMYTPRSHGRLYPKWKLPSLSVLHEVQSRFNAALEDHIGVSLQMLRSRKSKTEYPDPQESTLLTLRLSTSTLRTPSALTEVNSASKKAAMETPTADGAGAQAAVLIPQTLESDRDGSSSESDYTAKGNPPAERSLLNKPASHSSSQSRPQTANRRDTACDDVKLIQGKTQVSSIARDTNFHIAGALEIHVEWPTKAATDTNDRNSEVAYQVEWLSVNEAMVCVKQQAAAVIHVDSMQYHTPSKVDYHDGILLIARESVVRISPGTKSRLLVK